MSRGTPNSPFRIPPEVKTPAAERARAEGTNLTAVVVEYLRQYGTRTRPQDALNVGAETR